MIEAAIELLEVGALALLGWRAFNNGRTAEKALARYDQMKRLYEKTNRRIQEHIRSKLHSGR